ncbi:MAG: sulfatase-like hydrolase/transferase, partial [Bacteroidaceae bacterium]|nr:sulfatase-like hydrolase/transferase [Bacteroidaceae bacterium]
MAQQRPNVVIMYIDDMGIGDVSCFGGSYKPTPCIDHLARQGMRFTQYYSAAPVSSPSRCGILTGQYPLRHGINTFMDTRAANRRVEQVDYLDPSAPSMARAFQQAGYATAHIGKWHLGGGRDVTDAPLLTNYGYDYYLSTYESPDPDPVITSTRWIWAATDSVKRWDRTAYFVDKSLEWISQHRDSAFFLNLWPDDMHTPWVPEAYADLRDRWEREDAFVPVLQEMDKQLGRFLDELDRMGLADNTIIIFTSDNGPAPSFEQRRT